MSIGVRIRLHAQSEGLRRDIARIDELWSEGQARFGGPFVAGARFSVADAFFVPVAFRARTYGLALGEAAAAYAQRLLALPSSLAWEADALRETWREFAHEQEILASGTVIEDLRAAPH
jgi:glutathione S-transferase